MFEENELSPVEMLALRARQVGPEGEQEPPRLKMLSFRVPLDLLASIDAFASITAQSRNTTMIDLLRAGVYAVGNELDDPEQYQAARDHFFDQYMTIGE
jgi:hypothetical protein